MSTLEEDIQNAYQELERAINNYVRMTRDPEIRANYFAHEWVVAISVETMEPGKSGYTYFNFVAPPNSKKYSLRGLLGEAKRWYESRTKVVED